MKLKKISLFIITILLSTIFIGRVDAASASVSITSSKKQVLVGNEFNVTIKLSSSDNLGAWDYTLKYDSSQVKLVKGNQREAEDAGKSGVKNYSYTYTFKALKSCNTSISIKSYSIIDWASGSQMSISSVGSANVKIMTQAELEASYSTNNYLSKLEVSGYQLSPEFSKDVNAYTVVLPPEAETIDVLATKSDNTATVSGDGTIIVGEGDNVINVIVTSQKGTTRTYTITATVVDQNPINIKIDNKNYTVIKRASVLTCPSTFKEITTTINDIEVPAFYSEITNYTLIGLKNEKNEIGLYVYNEKDNSYIIYKEINFSKIVFSPMAITKDIGKYKEYQIKINDELVNVYKTSKNSKFALLYGTNVETGKTGYYLYDSEENTLQRYNEDELNLYRKDSKDFLILSIVFGTSLIITITIFICYVNKNNKIKNKLFGIKDKIKKDSKQELDKNTENIEITKEEKETEDTERKEIKAKKKKIKVKEEIDEDFKI